MHLWSKWAKACSGANLWEVSFDLLRTRDRATDNSTVIAEKKSGPSGPAESMPKRAATTRARQTSTRNAALAQPKSNKNRGAALGSTPWGNLNMI